MELRGRDVVYDNFAFRQSARSFLETNNPDRVASKRIRHVQELVPGEIRMKAKTHQPALAPRFDVWKSVYGLLNEFAIDDFSQPPGSFGKEKSLIRRERDRPWYAQSFGDDRDFMSGAVGLRFRGAGVQDKSREQPKEFHFL